MIGQIWFQNRQNIEKIVPRKNVLFNLKGRIPLLFYCVKHIHGQFKTYLKEGPEGVKWELGLSIFRLGKWDLGCWDWDLATGNGK
jgi:hypothetical protein